MTALGAVAASLLLSGRPQPRLAAVPASAATVRRPAREAMPSVAADAEYSRIILARPLLDPTRRPAATPITATAAGKAEAALPRLAGTIIGLAGYRAAILVPADGGYAVTVREGDRSNGIYVVHILPGEIMAESASGRVSISVSYDRGPAPLPPPPPLVKPVRVPLGIAVPVADPRVRAPGDQDE